MTLVYATKKSSSIHGEGPCVNTHQAPSTSHTTSMIASLVPLTERLAKSILLRHFHSPAPIMLPPFPFPFPFHFPTATPSHPPQNHPSPFPHLSPIPPPTYPINPSPPPPSPPPQPSQSSPATAEKTHPPHPQLSAPEPPPHHVRPGPRHSHAETSRSSPLLVPRVGFEECRVELVHRLAGLVYVVVVMVVVRDRVHRPGPARFLEETRWCYCPLLVLVVDVDLEEEPVELEEWLRWLAGLEESVVPELGPGTIVRVLPSTMRRGSSPRWNPTAILLDAGVDGPRAHR